MRHIYLDVVSTEAKPCSEFRQGTACRTPAPRSCAKKIQRFNNFHSFPAVLPLTLSGTARLFFAKVAVFSQISHRIARWAFLCSLFSHLSAGILRIPGVPRLGSMKEMPASSVICPCTNSARWGKPTAP